MEVLYWASRSVPTEQRLATVIQLFLLHPSMIKCTSVELPRQNYQHVCRSHSQRLTIYKSDSLVSNEYRSVLWEIFQYDFSRCLSTFMFWCYSSLEVITCYGQFQKCRVTICLTKNKRVTLLPGIRKRKLSFFPQKLLLWFLGEYPSSGLCVCPQETTRL